MKTYSVSEISFMLMVNKETVRRWIKSGKLKGAMNRGRTGMVVTELDLKEFLTKHPMYLNRYKQYIIKKALDCARQVLPVYLQMEHFKQFCIKEQLINEGVQ